MEQIMMLRFGDNPVDYEIPDGYEIRECRDNNKEDCNGWLKACETLFETIEGGRWSEEKFISDMINDPDCTAKNIFLICRKSDGAIAGTATAKDGEKPSLHMVGVNKEFMGQGLAYPICAAAVNRMIENGDHRIMLLTDEFRIPAIKTYLKMGFRPWYYLDDMQERWRGVFKDLGFNPDDYFAYDKTSFRKVKI
ncbi:MAG: GNAT family N-acetyltransferase [Eubacteriales bacterium]|nr:GNAT family N-acetyltransferase [Eubacteriales bacterium]